MSTLVRLQCLTSYWRHVSLALFFNQIKNAAKIGKQAIYKKLQLMLKNERIDDIKSYAKRFRQISIVTKEVTDPIKGAGPQLEGSG